MKFSNSENQHTGFKLFLDYEFGPLANNKAIVNGLKKWGKMTDEQARSYLIPGSGPTVVFGQVQMRSILDNDFPFSVPVPESIVKTFEDTHGKGDATFFKTGSGPRVHRLTVILLHR